jgi:hypothetical protein
VMALGDNPRRFKKTPIGSNMPLKMMRNLSVNVGFEFMSGN